ncbi:Uncharacterized protein conserved in bacteria [Bordetella ansorpii]|uniref:Uncharacterized protein conserved in bacteria n=2 Tax=Bordetella ansorpii TaxID=288768 RepID=A0A146AIU6_9BORD|nr:Uncharacterized protein conserved in bacteria [Bordetella ansorpii]
MNAMTTPTTGTSASSTISSKRVEGTKVYNQQGEKLGSIDNVQIDKHSGHVRYAVLEFGGFLGIGTDRYPLPWNMLKYDTGLDGYVVPLDKSTLDKAPHYEHEKAPEFTDEYGRRVHEHYGVPWQ